MKWIDRKHYRTQGRWQWHRYFVWRRPVAINELHVGELVIPRHKVWLGFVERRLLPGVGSATFPKDWEYRTAKAEP